MNCPQCQSENVCKNGHTREKQRYRCKDCGRQFMLNPGAAGRPKVDRDKQKAAKAAYMRRYRAKLKEESDNG